MDSNSVCNHTSDNKIGRRSGSPSCLSPSMFTDRIGRHEVLLPFNRKNYNFREKRNSQVMKGKKSLHCKTLKEGVNCLNVIG